MVTAFVLMAGEASLAVRAQQPGGATGPARPPAKKAAEAAKPDPKAVEAAARAEATEMANVVFRGAFLSELRFVRSASGASDEQARRLARAAGESLRSMVSDCVEAAVKSKREQKDLREFDWRKTYLAVHEKVAAIAAEQLSPEQRARFEAQAARRREHRKRVTLGSLLVGLDDELVLSAGQLTKLEQSLSSHWDVRWETEDVIDRPQPFPALPDALIVPFLTDAQQAAWKKLEKRAPGSGEFQWGMVMAELDEMAAQGKTQKDALEAELTAEPAAKR